MTLMEIEVGVLRVERRDATQGAKLRVWMTHHVLPEFLDRTLPVDAPWFALCTFVRARPTLRTRCFGCGNSSGSLHDSCDLQRDGLPGYRCSAAQSLEWALSHDDAEEADWAGEIFVGEFMEPPGLSQTRLALVTTSERKRRLNHLNLVHHFHFFDP